MSPKKNPQREREGFGPYLTELRENRTNLGTAAAAKELELKTRQQLDNYETGRTKPPDSILIKMARLYHVSPDEVLREVHWPQLIFLPLIAIVEPEQLPNHLVKELEKGLDKAERREITQHIEVILVRRRRVIKQH